MGEAKSGEEEIQAEVVSSHILQYTTVHFFPKTLLKCSGTVKAALYICLTLFLVSLAVQT